MSALVFAQIDPGAAPSPWVLIAASVGTLLAVSIRAALTAQVPPSWLRVPAPYRPALAVLCGAVLAFFTALKAGETWQAALIAAVGALAVALPPVLLAESGSSPPPPPPADPPPKA
jgi:hypothetical protein